MPGYVIWRSNSPELWIMPRIKIFLYMHVHDILYNQVLRIIRNAVKSDVKDGRI